MKKYIISILLIVSTMMAQAEVIRVQYRGLTYKVDTELQVAQLSRQTVTIKGDLPLRYQAQREMYHLPSAIHRSRHGQSV